MKKKIIALCMVVVLAATAVVGGSMAYLQDEDSDVNVMTLGNVDIEQHEYQRAEGVAHNAGESGAGNGVKEGALVPFVQDQALYPAVPKNNAATDYTAEATDLFFWGDYVYSGTAGNGLWNDNNLSNVMDKMVFVENTGKSDAYFRTIIAFECPEGMEYSQGSDKEFMMNINGSDLYNWESVGYITVNDVRYLVEVATYQNALKPEQQAHPSLLQVVMTHNATNEDMELLGDTYEILVLSQAVQVAGFADAAGALNTGFGEANEANIKAWFEAVLEENPGVELPDATVVELTNEEIEEIFGDIVKEYSEKTISEVVPFALQFGVTEESAEGKPYENWNADFVLVFDKDIENTKTLSGLEAFNDSIVLLGSYANAGTYPCPIEGDITAGEPIRVMQEFAKMDGMSGFYPLSYEFVLNFVDIFKCGVAFDPFDLKNIPDGTTATVQLRVYETDENGHETGKSYVIEEASYTYSK